MPAPKLSWSDLAGARVGIWGLGREGHASLRKLATLGAEPVLVDDQPSDPVDGRPVLLTGDGGLAALERCDAVVKTPGMSRYRPEVARLSARGVPVAGGLGLWLAEADLRRVLCVTGTKGKSTTSSVDRPPHRRPGLPCHGRREHRRPALRPGKQVPTSTTGSSRCPATRPPTCRARRRWSR